MEALKQERVRLLTKFKGRLGSVKEGGRVKEEGRR